MMNKQDEKLFDEAMAREARHDDKNCEIKKAPHYNQHPSGVECIQIIEHFSANLAFATKYIWRQGLKPDNDAIKDLKKARYYIDREIERLENASD